MMGIWCIFIWSVNCNDLNKLCRKQPKFNKKVNTLDMKYIYKTSSLMLKTSKNWYLWWVHRMVFWKIWFWLKIWKFSYILNIWYQNVSHKDLVLLVLRPLTDLRSCTGCDWSQRKCLLLDPGSRSSFWAPSQEPLVTNWISFSCRLELAGWLIKH